MAPRPEPEAYLRAWSCSTSGVHAVENWGLAERSDLTPWALKQAFRDNPGHEAHDQWIHGQAAVNCRVRNATSRLNEANVFILKSLLPNAGLGLFLRPTPPTTHRQLVIPPRTHICLYSRRPLEQSQSESDLASTDYLLEVDIGGTCVRFNPDVYTGEETGRFVNQGGLTEGLRELCRACNSQSGMQSYSAREVVNAITPHCNITYQNVRRSRLYIATGAERGLRSGSDVKELLGNYDIDYWVKYVVQNYKTLGTDSEMVKCVLWTLLSRYSVYEARDISLNSIPRSLHDHFREMPCPVSPQRSRR